MFFVKAGTQGVRPAVDLSERSGTRGRTAMPDRHERIPEHDPQMGDDEQEFEDELVRSYVEDPPPEIDLDVEDQGEIGISRWVRQETRTGDRSPDDLPAEEAALHVENRAPRSEPD
jgi:hypothetical protein